MSTSPSSKTTLYSSSCSYGMYSPFSLGLDVPLGRPMCGWCLLPAWRGGPLPLAPPPTLFHSSTFSIELMESSDTSITDCWYSLAPPGVSDRIIMLAAPWAPPPPGVGVEEGMGVGPPRVPYRLCPPPLSKCLAYVKSAYEWNEHLKNTNKNFIGH